VIGFKSPEIMCDKSRHNNITPFLRRYSARVSRIIITTFLPDVKPIYRTENKNQRIEKIKFDILKRNVIISEVMEHGIENHISRYEYFECGKAKPKDRQIGRNVYLQATAKSHCIFKMWRKFHILCFRKKSV